MPPKQDDLEPAGIDTSQQGVEISGESMQSKVISTFTNNNKMQETVEMIMLPTPLHHPYLRMECQELKNYPM